MTNNFLRRIIFDMKVAVIGHRELFLSEKIIELVKTQIGRLIAEGADTFYFANKGAFNDLCYKTVTEFKNTYDLKRVYLRAEYKSVNLEYINYLLTLYEETNFDDRVCVAGRYSYVKRNEIMIDSCDVLLTFYDDCYVPFYKLSHMNSMLPPKNVRSGTAIAVHYAKRKHKPIINIFDLLTGNPE